MRVDKHQAAFDTIFLRLRPSLSSAANHSLDLLILGSRKRAV